MSFRIQRRMNLGSGLGLNLSKSGASPSIRTKFGSVGAKGFSLRTGIKGLYIRQSWGKGVDGAIIGILVTMLMIVMNIGISITFFMLKIALYVGWFLFAVAFNVVGWIVLTLYDIIYYLIFKRMNSDEIRGTHKSDSI
ncbi:MAG: DUF4236 domain-containing protein [Candidatus Marinimicrobia bacterium]|nr:DUF4236 domain-containing protein [Candidatus Neomarinimicrobiota bacterium]